MQGATIKIINGFACLPSEGKIFTPDRNLNDIAKQDHTKWIRIILIIQQFN